MFIVDCGSIEIVMVKILKIILFVHVVKIKLCVDLLINFYLLKNHSHTKRISIGTFVAFLDKSGSELIRALQTEPRSVH